MTGPVPRTSVPGLGRLVLAKGHGRVAIESGPREFLEELVVGQEALRAARRTA